MWCRPLRQNSVRMRTTWNSIKRMKNVLSMHIIIHIILVKYLYVHLTQWRYTDNNRKNLFKCAIHDPCQGAAILITLCTLRYYCVPPYPNTSKFWKLLWPSFHACKGKAKLFSHFKCLHRHHVACELQVQRIITIVNTRTTTRRFTFDLYILPPQCTSMFCIAGRISNHHLHRYL